MASISLDDVALTFRVRRQRRITLKEYLVRRMFRRSVNPVMEVRALRDLHLQVGEGERVGIIGHNGAGKSTLLKVLAGVYPPTGGRCRIDGDVSALFDFTLGFEPLASGRENIHYRSYLQGETPSTIRGKIDSIAEFSELGEFLDTPVRFYSSGMIVRLGFAIATEIDPEVLLIDECLSAGDLSFQQKARRRLSEMVDRARLLVMVSHDIDSIAELCNRAIWMDHGCIRQDGPIDEVLGAYRAHMERPQNPPQTNEAAADDRPQADAA